MPVPSTPQSFRVEHHRGHLPVIGIGTPSPRLSWQVPTAEPGYVQGAYEIELVPVLGERECVRVESREQVLVPWPFEPLQPRQAVDVRVRVRDTARTGMDGSEGWSGWSPSVRVEAGLCAPHDWSARFISPRTIGGLRTPAPVLGATLVLPAPVVQARLYVTALGCLNAFVNGRRVGEEQLAPGWTSYDNRLRYRTHVVTDLLEVGENRMQVQLGNGWYRGRLGWSGGGALYGERLAVLAQLEVTCDDGSRHVLASDDRWTATESNILSDDLYDGQRTDLRSPALGGVAAGGDAVDVLDVDLRKLVAPDGPPVRVTEVVPAAAVSTTPAGATLVDFGQNVVGWVRLRVRGAAPGDEVVLRHAEVLEAGELSVRPLRTAKATDTYLLAGAPEEVLEPSLTFHGFRYVEVRGVAELHAEDIEACVLGTDLYRTGWFSSSDELLDRFHDNVVWGMRGNFLDVPTDCPQRDERLGWTGDIQVFAPTASFLFDCAGFLTSWLADLAAEQEDDGSVPFVVPDVLRENGPAASAWGDAAVVVPWVLYERTGDVELIRRQLPSMRAWVDRMHALAGADLLWTGGFQFGDWLDPTAPPDDPAQAKADPDVVATAHFARGADLVAGAARVVGDIGTAEGYADLAARVRTAFADEYVTEGGRVLSDSQTVYALALRWDLLPQASQRARAARRLADLVRAAGFRIGTGFVGTPLVTDALTDAGYARTAYRLLLQTGCPSWLYPVTMGATTVWERWDSLLPDGSVNAGEMTSFNHYALGAVADWLHRRVAGLAPAAPGYRRLDVRPVPSSALTHAYARHLTPYGEASVGWHRQDGVLTVRLSVPVGVTADVVLPGPDNGVAIGETQQVAHGEHVWQVTDWWAQLDDQADPRTPAC